MEEEVVKDFQDQITELELLAQIYLGLCGRLTAVVGSKTKRREGMESIFGNYETLTLRVV